MSLSSFFSKGYNDSHDNDSYNNTCKVGTDEWKDYLVGNDLGEEDLRIERGY